MATPLFQAIAWQSLPWRTAMWESSRAELDHRSAQFWEPSDRLPIIYLCDPLQIIAFRIQSRPGFSRVENHTHDSVLQRSPGTCQVVGHTRVSAALWKTLDSSMGWCGGPWQLLCHRGNPSDSRMMLLAKLKSFSTVTNPSSRKGLEKPCVKRWGRRAAPLRLRAWAGQSGPNLLAVSSLIRLWRVRIMPYRQRYMPRWPRLRGHERLVLVPLHSARPLQLPHERTHLENEQRI